MSNSKLDRVQKSVRKDLLGSLIENSGEIFSFPEMRVTVLIVRTGETSGSITWAICSEGESKFRRKYGEFIALNRWFDDNMLPFEFSDGEGPRDVAENFAYTIPRV